MDGRQGSYCGRESKGMTSDLRNHHTAETTVEETEVRGERQPLKEAQQNSAAGHIL